MAPSSSEGGAGGELPAGVACGSLHLQNPLLSPSPSQLPDTHLPPWLCPVLFCSSCHHKRSQTEWLKQQKGVRGWLPLRPLPLVRRWLCPHVTFIFIVLLTMFVEQWLSECDRLPGCLGGKVLRPPDHQSPTFWGEGLRPAVTVLLITGCRFRCPHREGRLALPGPTLHCSGLSYILWGGCHGIWIHVISLILESEIQLHPPPYPL